MKSIFTTVFFAVLLISCSGSKNAEAENPDLTVVSGQLTNASPNQPVYLDDLSGNAPTPLDTSEVDESGFFQLSTSMEQTGFYRLRVAENNFIILILSKGEKVSINGEFADLARTYTVSGSNESVRFKKLQEIRTPLDSLQAIVTSAQKNQDMNTYMTAMQSKDQLVAQVRKGIYDLIDEEPGSVASIAAVQVLDMNQDLHYFEKVVDAISETHPELSQYYQGMKTQVALVKKLGIGREAPEINLQTPEGEFVALSSLRGKVVLIDFWASWCKPCRAENPNVRKVYTKYKDKGFEIYGVSLDKNKEPWVKAIADDQLPWKHVSDLGGWQSSITPLYDVKSIPLTFLIDEEGKILAKNLRGPALETKLQEIFGG